MSEPQVSTSLILQIALADQQKGAFEKAEKGFRQLIEIDPDSFDAHNYLGALLAHLGRFDEALPFLEKGVALDGENASVLSTIAQVYGAMGHIDKATSTAEHLVKTNPSWPEAHLIKGTAARYSGDHEGAILSYSKSIELNPKLMQGLMALADLYNALQRYSEAIEVYERALVLDENDLNLLMGYGMALHAIGEIEKAADQYKKASSLSPNNLQILTLLGNVYRDLGDEDKAILHYEQILRMDPENAIAKENLSKISSGSILAWHFAMLADHERNSAYRQAIESKVQKGHHVLDIGAGSGLLSMMAARAGAEAVTAFEMVGNLSQVAQRVVADNKLEDKIKIHNRKSTAAVVGDHLPRKVDVLVSEILDAGLLGEGVLPSHRHALGQLTVENPEVVPMGAEIKGCLIQCDAFHAVYPPRDIEGFDLSAFEKFRNADNYVTQHLRKINHQRLTDEISFWEVNFKNLPPFYPLEDPNKTLLKFPVTQDGEVHAVAFWFDLHLTEDIVRSSAPDGEMVHWGQAVFYFDIPRSVKSGEEIEVVMCQSEIKIGFEWPS